MDFLEFFMLVEKDQLLIIFQTNKSSQKQQVLHCSASLYDFTALVVLKFFVPVVCEAREGCSSTERVVAMLFTLLGKESKEPIYPRMAGTLGLRLSICSKSSEIIERDDEAPGSVVDLYAAALNRKT
jgi:hypothetical protein